MADVLLRVERLSLHFGGFAALQEVSAELRAGEVLGLIGPNSTGKTLPLNCISGFYRPQSGRDLFDRQDITRLGPPWRAALGMAKTFQQIELYSGMSTLDTLMAGRHIQVQSLVMSNSDGS